MLPVILNIHGAPIKNVTLYFLLLARYVSNVAKRSIWNQCNIKDRANNDRPLFLEEPSWKIFKRAHLYNGAR